MRIAGSSNATRAGAPRFKFLGGDASPRRPRVVDGRGRLAGVFLSASKLAAYAANPGRRLTRFAASLGLLCASGVAAAAGDRVALDFSTAGYEQGGQAIPTVPARFRVEISSRGDDTAAIQAALDAVAALPVGADGFRGAVALQPGSYHVAGQLVIKASGVVLRGNGSTLVATGHSRRTLILVQGRDDRTPGPALAVTDENVPVGATTLHLESVDGLAPGSRVVVQRPSTQTWIIALDMDKFIGPSTRWTNFKKQRLDWLPGTRDIEWERTVVAVEPATRMLTLDAPLTTALEKRYGGGTVRTITWPGRLNHVGVENLACVSEFAAPTDEEHAWICVSLDRVENAWVRNITSRHFVCSAVWVGANARAVTVQDCVNAEPVSEWADGAALVFLSAASKGSFSAVRRTKAAAISSRAIVRRGRMCFSIAGRRAATATAARSRAGRAARCTTT